MKEFLESLYKVKIEEALTLGRHQGFKSGNEVILIFDAGQFDQVGINELGYIAEHLHYQGEKRILRFKPTLQGNLVSEWEGQRYCVLTSEMPREYSQKNVGKRLAKFHMRGRTISFKVQALNRTGQWKQLWEKRLDQMEKVWNEKLYQEPDNEFERMFIESFPYYMGLSENAIQYLVDTEMDDKPAPVDYGTVCHERFTTSSWNSNYLIKNPFDWVFDHCSRDVSEWVRDRYLQNIKTFVPDVRDFVKDYQGNIRLSSFSWRLLYARLLFPLHYFETVENYYINQSESERHWLEDKLEKYLSQSGDYEQFTRDFFQVAEVPVRTMKIPQIDWLVRK